MKKNTVCGIKQKDDLTFAFSKERNCAEKVKIEIEFSNLLTVYNI
jgi:hypothetical protein